VNKGVVAPEEDIMTLQDLLVAEQIGRFARLDPARVALEDEARRHRTHGGVRHSIGRAFVRVGRWLDSADPDAAPLTHPRPESPAPTTMRHTW
jgi:hypothetical protein